MFVAREMEAQMETVQGPQRLVNAKRALDVSSGLASALSQFDLTAPFKSGGQPVESISTACPDSLGVGSFLVYWGPYLVGLAIFVTLSFFPVVLLWSLFPGQALQAPGQLLPAARLRVLDPPVVGAGGRRRRGGLRTAPTRGLVRGAGGLGRGVHQLHGGDGAGDHPGAGSSGHIAVRYLEGPIRRIWHG